MRTKCENPCMQSFFLPFFNFSPLHCQFAHEKKDEISRSSNDWTKRVHKIQDWKIPHEMLSLTDFAVTFFFFVGFLSLSLMALVCVCCVGLAHTHRHPIESRHIHRCLCSVRWSPGIYSMAIVKGNKIAFPIFVILLNQYSRTHTHTVLPQSTFNQCLRFENVCSTPSNHSMIYHYYYSLQFSMNGALRAAFPWIGWQEESMNGWALFSIRHENLIETFQSIETSGGTMLPSSKTFMSENRTLRRNQSEKVLAYDETTMKYTDRNQYNKRLPTDTW